jgi:hypothetical protein
MNTRKTRSGRFEARMMVNGVRYTSTQPTLEDAVDWLKVLQAQEVTGGLPRRITVEQYSLRWMTTYEGSPTSTRTFHRGNLDRHILPVLGSRTVADVTPTEIHRLLNGLKASVSVATADAVYRTCSALFNAAVADDVMVRSPVKAKHHRPRRQREAKLVLERQEARRPAPAPQGLAPRHRPPATRPRGAGRGDRRAEPTRRRHASPPGHHPSASLPRHGPRHQEPPHAHPGAADHHPAHPRAADRGRRRRPTDPIVGRPRARR